MSLSIKNGNNKYSKDRELMCAAISVGFAEVVSRKGKKASVLLFFLKYFTKPHISPVGMHVTFTLDRVEPDFVCTRSLHTTPAAVTPALQTTLSFSLFHIHTG